MNTFDLGQQIKLSPKQHEAIQLILQWHKSNDRFFVLAGYAGSGKTTLAKRIAEKLGGVFCAYTAKAAQVLQSKGLPASTIHSLIYEYEGRDEETDKLIFSLKHEGGGAFLIVDEYSMIDSATLDDLKRKYHKILFLGDPAQLPPIEDKKQVLTPDFFLDEIHRQATGNPIIKWAHNIRNGNVPMQDMNDNNQFIVKRKDDLTDEELGAADQIICGTNKTRRDINNYMRKLLGFSNIADIPAKGERIVCRKNNKQEGLVNGATFVLDRPAKNWSGGSFEIFVNGKYYNVWDGDVLGRDQKEYNYKTCLERFDYAYAITAHKSQGSEYDSIIVINEAWGDQRLNWIYTAVTRGKKKVILAN